MEQLIFVVVVAFLFTHELDAVGRHEWRIMPLVNRLSDKAGFAVFVLAHIPLFALVLWAMFVTKNGATEIIQLGFSAFCIIHVLLHKLLESHPANEFNNPLSQFLIWGSGIAGAAHMVIVLS